MISPSDQSLIAATRRLPRYFSYRSLGYPPERRGIGEKGKRLRDKVSFLIVVLVLARKRSDSHLIQRELSYANSER